MVTVETETIQQIYNLLKTISDPEIPTVSITDLGLVRNVEFINNKVIVTITPTYSACPAMHFIEREIINTLQLNLFENVEVKINLNPAWSTDWVTKEGKIKLKESGIAPPLPIINKVEFKQNTITCPYCNSNKTILKSEFGSTACKSFYFCEDCLTPFDYFKSI